MQKGNTLKYSSNVTAALEAFHDQRCWQWFPLFWTRINSLPEPISQDLEFCASLCAESTRQPNTVHTMNVYESMATMPKLVSQSDCKQLPHGRESYPLLTIPTHAVSHKWQSFSLSISTRLSI